MVERGESTHMTRDSFKGRPDKVFRKRTRKTGRKAKRSGSIRSIKNLISPKIRKRKKSFMQSKVSKIDSIFKIPQLNNLIQKMKAQDKNRKKGKKKKSRRQRKNKEKTTNKKRERRIPYHQYTSKPRYLVVSRNQPFSKRIKK